MPLAGLKPGSYVCQLNVIDDAGGSFAFPRFAVLVREPTALAAPTEPAASTPATPRPGSSRLKSCNSAARPIRVF